MVNLIKRIGAVTVLVLLMSTPGWAETSPSPVASETQSAPPKAGSTRVPLENTARTLDRGEWRIGLLKTDYGITDYLSVGTYHLYCALVMPNFTTKISFWESGDSAISLTTGLFYVDSKILWALGSPEDEAVYLAWPLELEFTLPVTPSLFVTSGIGANFGVGEGEFDAGTTQGLAGVQQLVIPFHLEWMASDFWVFGLKVKYSPFSSISGEGGTSVQLDSATKVDVDVGGAVDPQALSHAVSAVGYVLMRWQKTNVRVGGGWGSFTIPGLNIMAANRMPLVDLDVFWRF